MQAGEQQSWRRVWREWIQPLLVIVVVMSAMRSSLADWNDVPTGSMRPTIVEGDRIFVNKLAYDLKVPFTTCRLATWNEPARGEIVVFFSPANGDRLVKRVIGLPGDRIELRDNQLWVNDEPLAYVERDPATFPDAHEDPAAAWFAEEALPGRPHPILLTRDRLALRSFGPVLVPANTYFMMGDNRDNSFDSRWFGPVERWRIVGRASAVVVSGDPQHWFWPRWNRCLSWLQ